jgi:diaminopropionate ammonia-lyase
VEPLVLVNPGRVRDPGMHSSPDDAPLAFHRRLPGYAPTPIVDAPELAAALGCSTLSVKDESLRFGLPAFKILGASWAVYRLLVARLGHEPGWQTLDELRTALVPLGPLTLVAATDGNHGRAVARMARLLNLDANVFVAADMDPARIAAIEGEGAHVTKVDGTYDDAVARSAAEAGERCLVISDTSWSGYHDVPSWVIEGYSSIFWEIDDELTARGEPGPTVVAVQIGVGALAAAVVRHYRRPDAKLQPFILGVEPTHAACVLASMEAAGITLLPGPHDSIMAGLNAGLPSEVAWPWVSQGIDAFIAIDDKRALDAVQLLAGEGLTAGETGAAGLAGILGWLEPSGNTLANERLLLICTEGPTGSRI